MRVEGYASTGKAILDYSNHVESEIGEKLIRNNFIHVHHHTD